MGSARPYEVPGEERAVMVAEYGSGLTIRQVAAGHRRSFGGVRAILVRAGVVLRPRGGNHDVRKLEKAPMHEKSTGFVREHLRSLLGADAVDGVGGEPKSGSGGGLVVWTSPGYSGVITTVRRSDHVRQRWSAEFLTDLVRALEKMPGARAEPVQRQDRITVYWPGA